MTETKTNNIAKKTTAEKKENLSPRREAYRSFLSPLFNFFDDLPDFHDGDYNIMKTDIKDADDHYELEMEVPGIDKKDLKVAIRNGYLVVSAEFNKKSDESKGKYIHYERESGSFTRSFYVGEGLKTKDISAKMENGVLVINVPKESPEEDKDEFVEVL